MIRTQSPVRLELLRTFTVDGGQVMAAAFSPDGRLLATGGERGDLRLLEVASREVRWHKQPAAHWIGTIEFTADGQRIACMGNDLTLHQVSDGRELERHVDTGPHGFACQPDGKEFAFARRKEVFVHDGAKVAAMAEFEYPVNALAFAADGGLFVGDNVGRTWQIPAGSRTPKLLRDHRSDRSSTARSLALAVRGEVLFDLASGCDLRRGDRMFAPPGSVYAFAVAADGLAFAVGGDPASVRWWRQGGDEVRDVAAAGVVVGLALHPNGDSLLIATKGGELILHRTDAESVSLPPHRSPVRRMAMSPDGSAVAIQGPGWSLQAIDGSPPRGLPGARHVCAGRTGSELLVTATDRCVFVDGRTNVETDELRVRPSRHPALVGPGGRVLMRGQLYDAIGEPTEFSDLVLFRNRRDTAHATDGRWAIGTVGGIEGDIGSLLVTDATGMVLHKDDDPVYTVAFSPSGDRLLYSYGHGISVGMGPLGKATRVMDAHTFRVLTEVAEATMHWRFLDERTGLAQAGDKLQLRASDSLTVLERSLLDVPCHDFDLSVDRRTLVVSTGADVRLFRLHTAD
jgi:hypothetical protein